MESTLYLDIKDDLYIAYNLIQRNIPSFLLSRDSFFPDVLQAVKITIEVGEVWIGLNGEFAFVEYFVCLSVGDFGSFFLNVFGFFVHQDVLKFFG